MREIEVKYRVGGQAAFIAGWLLCNVARIVRIMSPEKAGGMLNPFAHSEVTIEDEKKNHRLQPPVGWNPMGEY